MQCFRLVKAASDLDITEHMITRVSNFSSFSMKTCCAAPHLNFLFEAAQMKRSQNLFDHVSDQYQMLTL